MHEGDERKTNLLLSLDYEKYSFSLHILLQVYVKAVALDIQITEAL